MKHLNLITAITFVFLIVSPAFVWWTSGICAVLAALHFVEYRAQRHEDAKHSSYSDWY